MYFLCKQRADSLEPFQSVFSSLKGPSGPNGAPGPRGEDGNPGPRVHKTPEIYSPVILQ